MNEVTVVIPHCLTVKWTQILISSLKKFNNYCPFDILLMDNSPDGNESVKAISETALGKGIKIVRPHPNLRWHAGALDAAIDLVDTPYFFSIETDCRILRDGWLDWYFSKVQDNFTAMVGWFWEVPGEGRDRLYINSSATLYRTEILKRLKAETLKNDNFMLCYGTFLKRRMEMPERLLAYWKKGNWGPFQEIRGYQEVFHHRDDKWYHEPGCWLYFRAQCEYECVRVPGRWEFDPPTRSAAATWYGSDSHYFLVHYWGGTVSHNWEKQLVVTPWEIKTLPFWIERENRIWKEVVDQESREKTYELGLLLPEEEEKRYILDTRIHSLNKGDRVMIVDYEIDESFVKPGELPVSRWSKKVPATAVVNEGICLGMFNDGCHVKTENGDVVKHPNYVVKIKGEKNE